MKRRHSNKSFDGILLDQFSDADLRSWKKLAEDADKFHIQLFYHLEGQRSLHKAELCQALLDVKGRSLVKERWCRIVDYKYSHEPLSSKGSLIHGGRFNIGSDVDKRFNPFSALYIAEDGDTAYAEKWPSEPQDKSGLFGHEFALRRTHSFAKIDLDLNLNNLFDLSNLTNLKRFAKVLSSFTMPREFKELGKKLGFQGPWLIKTAEQLQKSLLDINWRHHPAQFDLPANPQLFGRFLKDVGFEGVLFPSTRMKGKKCVAVFTENLKDSNSYISLSDASPPTVRQRMDGSNWEDLSRM